MLERLIKGLNTLFSSKEGAATISEIGDLVKEGKIIFADGAEISFLRCNTADHIIPFVDSLSEQFSEDVKGVYVTGSTVHFELNISNKKERFLSNMYEPNEKKNYGFLP